MRYLQYKMSQQEGVCRKCGDTTHTSKGSKHVAVCIKCRFEERDKLTNTFFRKLSTGKNS